MMKLENLRKEAETKTIALRSCWNCNSLHEHLKKAKCVIMCIWCGNYFYKGTNITQEEDNKR